MNQTLKTIKQYVLELIFPTFCFVCEKEGDWLCPACLKKISFAKCQACPVCRKENKEGRVCRACQAKTYLNQLVVAANYNNEVIQKMIHLLKYSFAYEIRQAFFQVLTRFFQTKKIKFAPQSLIIPIPLHRKRLRWRGFNQALIISEEMARIFPLKIVGDNLQRIRYTHPQVELTAQARKNNLKNAFFCQKELEISGQSVIVIDDVYTTGSTMNEAAKILKKAGAKEVIGFVIARG